MRVGERPGGVLEPGMCGHLLRGNREIRESSSNEERLVKEKFRTTDMNDPRKSDSLIVSGKPSNKMRDNKRMAERVERRRLAKGNLSKQNKSRTQIRGIL